METPKTGRLAYDLVTGGMNKDTVSRNASFTDAFTVTNPLPQPIRVFGIQLRFKAGLEKSLLNIESSGGDKIISGDVEFSQVGNKSSADVVRDELPVDFIMPANQIYKIRIAPSADMQPGDVNIAFFSKKV